MEDWLLDLDVFMFLYWKYIIFILLCLSNIILIYITMKYGLEGKEDKTIMFTLGITIIVYLLIRFGP